MKFGYFSSLSLIPIITTPTLVSCKKIETNKKESDNKNSSVVVMNHKIKLQDNLPYEITENQLEIDKAIKIENINKINDGDTFRFQVKLAHGITYSYTSRFAGIDTPETHKYQNGTFVDTDGIQYEYGKRAEQFTTSILQMPNIEIYIVPQKTKTGDDQIRDIYGRIISINYIKINNKWINLNTELVRLGFARKAYISLKPSSTFFTTNQAYYYELSSAQEYAMNNKLGIFAQDADFAKIYPKAKHE
ncbi:thermonuclease family protein [Mycoplasma sp. HS2188]|uniref:thermonuclease family protein n=1 Tax=Mycoplasma sp. HS2188 TaxID=2976765 RepID=UPI0021A99B08|nr:thermonuclease family protein [Mycoplasma sp. HS2188]MCT4469353.1 thermonuclease family protein [Mycoplasma sp. HS2188]